MWFWVHFAVEMDTPDMRPAGEWRADAAEEWRLSSESKLLDLTFEEVSISLSLSAGSTT